MRRDRFAVATSWSAFIMESALLGVLALPMHGSRWAQLAGILSAVAVTAAVMATFAAASPRRVAPTLGAAAVAAVTAGSALGALQVVAAAAMPAFAVLSAGWVAVVIAAGWSTRHAGARQRVWFWAGIGAGIVGMFALSYPASYLASAAGGDAMAGVAMLGAPAFAVFALAGCALAAGLGPHADSASAEVGA